MSKSLIAISAELQEILSIIDENEGVITPELEAQLAITEKSLATKADNYYLFIEELKARAEFLKDQAAKFSAAKRAVENLSTYLTDKIKFCMKETDRTEVVGESFYFKYSPGKKEKIIIDESKVPQEFKIPVTTYEVDKEAIERVLAAGIEIPGVTTEKIYRLTKGVKRK